MPIRRVVPSLAAVSAAVAFAATPIGASALGFGASRLATTLGGPLDFSVVVLLDGNETLPRECIGAEVFVGETRLPPAQVLAVVEAGASARQQTVRVQTTVGIAEPLVSIDVVLGCEARVTRRFVHLVDPPPIGTPVLPPGTAPTAAPPASGPPTAERSRRAPKVLRAPAARQPAPASAPRAGVPLDAVVAIAESPSATDAPPRWSLPAPLVRWLDALPFPAAHATLRPAEAVPIAPVERLAQVAVAAAPTGSAEQARIVDLEAGLAELRGETRETQREMAILQGRLRDAERDRWANPVVYASTALALIACLVALRASRQGAAARRPEGSDEAAEARVSAPPPLRRAVDAPSAVLRTTDQVPFPDRRAVDRSIPLDARTSAAALATMASSISAGASLANEAPEPTTTKPIVEKPAESRPERRDASLVSADGPHTTRPAAFDTSLTRPTTISESSAIGGLEVTTMMAPVRAAREAANTGAHDSAWQPMQASAVEELVDLMQQVEFFTVLGQDAPAVDLLEGHVRSATPASPLPFLDLLAIHARRDDEAAHARVRGLWQARFGDDAPTWERRERDLDDLGGLVDERTVMARLQALWATPLQALAALEGLLFREEDPSRVFARPVYHDLHFLYGLTRDLADHVETDSGAVDLFLPIETQAATPFTVLEATTPFRGPAPDRGASLVDDDPSSSLDVDLSAWPDVDEAAAGPAALAEAGAGADADAETEEYSIVRMPGRRGAA